MTPEQIAQENARTGNTMAAIRGNAQRIGSSTTIPGSPKDVEAYGEYSPETNVYERDPNLANKITESDVQDYARTKSASKATGVLPGGDETHRTSLTNYQANAFPVANRAGQGEDPSGKSAADSAKEIANATPSRVGEVLDKIAEEEKKGGPNFWDAIEAAAAGWNGKIPLYVQKEIQRKDAETAAQQQARAEQAAKEEQAQAYEQEKSLQAQNQAFQETQAKKESDLRLQLAGLMSANKGPMNPMGSKMNLADFAPGLVGGGKK
jgi:hypothetical protein